MPYFAHVSNGRVLSVERIEAAVMKDDDGNEQEALGQQYLAALYPGTNPEQYVLTVYSPDDSPVFRGKYAGVGDTWDGTNFTVPDALAP